MKVLAYVNLPFDIDLKKEKAYIVLKDGYYIQKVKLMPIPKRRETRTDIEELIWDMDAETIYALGFNKCLGEIEK